MSLSPIIVAALLTSTPRSCTRRDSAWSISHSTAFIACSAGSLAELLTCIRKCVLRAQMIKSRAHGGEVVERASRQCSFAFLHLKHSGRSAKSLVSAICIQSSRDLTNAKVRAHIRQAVEAICILSTPDPRPIRKERPLVRKRPPGFVAMRSRERLKKRPKSSSSPTSVARTDRNVAAQATPADTIVSSFEPLVHRVWASTDREESSGHEHHHSRHVPLLH